MKTCNLAKFLDGRADFMIQMNEDEVEKLDKYCKNRKMRWEVAITKILLAGLELKNDE